jgi:hypothetical protein
LVMEVPWLEGAYADVTNARLAPAEDWQVRALRFLLLGSASPRPNIDGSALPAWSEVRSALGVTGLTLDVSATGFGLRGGVLRQSQQAP